MKRKRIKYRNSQYPKHVVIDLNTNTVDKDHKHKHIYPSSHEDISEEVDEYCIGMRAQTGISINIQKKNEIIIQNSHVQHNTRSRMQWDKKKEISPIKDINSSSVDIDELYMIQKKIQIIQEAEEES